MNHDEFMRRTVAMSSLDRATRDRIARLGHSYLAEVHGMDHAYEGDELVKL